MLLPPSYRLSLPVTTVDMFGVHYCYNVTYGQAS